MILILQKALPETTSIFNKLIHSETFVEKFLLTIITGLILAFILSEKFRKILMFLRNIIFKSFIKVIYPKPNYKESDIFFNETKLCILDFENNFLSFNGFRKEPEYREKMHRLLNGLKDYIKREVINKTIRKEKTIQQIDKIIQELKCYKNNMLVTRIDEENYEESFGFDFSQFNFNNYGYGIYFNINKLPKHVNLKLFVENFYKIQQEFIQEAIDYLEKEKLNHLKIYFSIIRKQRLTNSFNE